MASVKIDGVEYDVPTADTYTLDEWQLFYEQAHLKPEELEELGNGFHPGATKAALVVAIIRARSDVTVKEASKRVGEMTLADLGGVFTDEEGDGAPDPTEGETDNSEQPDSSGGNGDPGSTTNPEPVLPVSSGPPASDTTSTSPPLTSVG